MTFCGEKSGDECEIDQGGKLPFCTLAVSGTLTQEAADKVMDFYRGIRSPALVLLTVNVCGGDLEAALFAASEMMDAYTRGVKTVAIALRARGAGLVFIMESFARFAIPESELGDLRCEPAFPKMRSIIHRSVTDAAFVAMCHGRVFNSEAAECFGLVDQLFPSVQEVKVYIRKLLTEDQ